MIGFWLINFIVALALSVTFTVVIFRFVGVDLLGKKPNSPIRRGTTENNRSIPLSGILLVPVTLLSTLLALGILSFWNATAVKTSLLESGIDPFFVICALMAMYLTGLCKDLSRVRESVLLIVEGICAALIILGGLRITSLQGLFSIEEIPSASSSVLTALVIIVAINTVAVIARREKAGKGICTLVLLYYCLALLGFGDYLFSVLAATALGFNIVGGNLNQESPLFRLGSTGGFTMGLIVSMLAIRLSQGIPPETTFLGSWTNPVILALTPILILTALALYSLRHKE